MPAPSAKDELKNLILQALRRSYVSESCCDKIPTGNHYQSVKLGDERTAGFRSDRQEFFDQIDFAGKRVLDLGSNLGEMSRSARERGASQVDGFEYDPFFVDIANMVNAYNDVARVAFYKRDITDPTIYDEHYDIVFCFSAFTYVTRVLEQVAAITDEVFILETHRLTDNLKVEYLDPLLRYFPYYAILGDSDWGRPHDVSERRMVIAFAKQAPVLANALHRHLGIQSGKQSVTPYLNPQDALERATISHVNAARMRWYDEFFRTFRFDSPEQLLAAIGGMTLDVNALSESYDARVLEYRGWTYWLIYVRGYLQYAGGGAIGTGNVYYDYMRDHFLQRDPGLNQQTSTPEQLIERIERRFHDVDLLRVRGADAFDGLDAISAPLIILGDAPPADDLPLYVMERGEQLHARYVDGHHRLFAAKLLGLPAVPCRIVAEDQSPPYLRGVIERFSYDGSRLAINGWGIRRDVGIDLFDIRVDGRVIASVPGTHRKDVLDAFHDISHAANSGFNVACEYRTDDASLIRFDIIARSRLLPVGRMSICYVDGMFAPREWAPALLAASSPEKLATRAVTSLYQLLEPLTRHRALASFGSVLDWGDRVGSHAHFLAHFLPNASLTSISEDEDAISWCQRAGLPGDFAAIPPLPPTDLPDSAFDLVIADGPMVHLGRDEQIAWLAELRRVLRPGGYLVLTVNGELIWPFHASVRVRSELDTIGIADATRRRENEEGERSSRVVYQTKAYAFATYADGFNIIEYIAGAIESQRDLVLLRKR